MINKKVALLTEDHLLFIVFQVLNMICLFCVNIYSFLKRYVGRFLHQCWIFILRWNIILPSEKKTYFFLRYITNETVSYTHLTLPTILLV